MIEEVRHDLISCIALEFLQNNNINSLPVNPFEIIARNKNWRGISYINYAVKYSLSYADVMEMTDSKDGCTFFQPSKQKFLILYNDDPAIIFEPKRIIWTLMHEIGHIELKHFELLNTAQITKDLINKTDYEVLEQEADIFASLVLAPHCVLDKIDVENYNRIMDVCGLSREASIYRFKELKQWQKKGEISDVETKILSLFKDFINIKQCTSCYAQSTAINANYCFLCGEKLRWGFGIMKYYDGFLLNENGKAIICPVCENEDITIEGEFCHICGTYLVNKCVGITELINGNEVIIKKPCSVPAQGNARYCIYCGSPTSFHENKLLQPWKEEKTEKQKSYEEIPF